MIKYFASKILASFIHHANVHWYMNPFNTQKKVLKSLLKSAIGTKFAKYHSLRKVKTYEELKKAVPIRTYELYQPYIERILLGEVNVLCKGKPIYFAKTSGTTAGAKYIPLTKNSLMFQITAARHALLEYIYQTGNNNFLFKKMIFLQGSPKLIELSGIKIGRLSGIVAHHIPAYLKKNTMPSWETNCIEDWEKKIDNIVTETLKQDMSLISGIPPWIKMYFEKLRNKSGKTIGHLFPNFSLMVTGGVNYTPYKKIIKELINKEIDIIQIYAASEGFIAYQDNNKQEGLLLLLNHGIFYEFIPLEDFYLKKHNRINIENVEIGVDYVLIINTSAGLWGYNIGDTIRFLSKKPYRIIITGRIDHYLSAFGEHVITYEVEHALAQASKKYNCTVVDFSVAPNVNPSHGLPYHEWYIEFEKMPNNLNHFAQAIDLYLRRKNIYYNDLIVGKILKPLIIKILRKDGIKDYMKSIGKLGGQNKIPHLSNNREIANNLKKYLLNN